MNRLLPLLLILLLLCGCAVRNPEESTTETMETTLPVTEPADTPGNRAPLDEPEIWNDGAVRCYTPDVADAYGLRIMNGDVLVFSGTEHTTLTRYTGDRLYTVGQIQLDCRIEPEDTSVQITGNGITYHNPETNQLIFLDNELKEVRRLDLPADLMGKAVLSSDRTQVYYCTADAVRVLDTSAGLDKLLKSISYPVQTVENVLQNDSILHCERVDDQGRESSIFLSTQTGEQIYALDENLMLETDQDVYFAKLPDGVLTQILFSRAGEEVQALYPLDAFAESWILAQSHSAVTASVRKQSTSLDRYDLETGLRTASVELPGGIHPLWAAAMSDGDSVFLLAYALSPENPRILRWDTTATAVSDSNIYTGPRYTAEDPDTAGLSQCAALTRELSDKYGVTVRIGTEATALQPWDYTLEYEYQVSLIRQELAVLDDLLAKFPEGFFGQLPGKTHLCIVRSITGTAASGSLDQAGGLQFWDGENAYVVLAAGEGLQQSFFHEFFHVIDTRVLSVSRAYYQWADLNPKGCEYFEDYTSWLTGDVSQYLQDENRAFIDAYSMCYPREDRARVMEYACMAGNSHYFQSEVMQKKLITLCQGIREAFGLEDCSESFLWEQYLKEPLGK